jgi:hypothetical protein
MGSKEEGSDSMNQNSLSYEIQAVMPQVIATGLLVSLFTAQSPSNVFGPTGAADGGYSNVAGLVNIPCTAPPPSDSRIQAVEVKNMQEIASSELHHVLLNSWYPQLDLGWRDGWRAVVDSYDYDILGVESDSQMQMTRVTIRLVTT